MTKKPRAKLPDARGMLVDLVKGRLPNGTILSLPSAICDSPPAAEYAQPVAQAAQYVVAIALALAEQAPPELKSIGFWLRTTSSSRL